MASASANGSGADSHAAAAGKYESPADWRDGVSKDTRKRFISELYREVLRISGETVPREVMEVAEKHEHHVWIISTSRAAYLNKLHTVINNLRRNPAHRKEPASALTKTHPSSTRGTPPDSDSTSTQSTASSSAHESPSSASSVDISETQHETETEASPSITAIASRSATQANERDALVATDRLSEWIRTHNQPTVTTRISTPAPQPPLQQRESDVNVHRQQLHVAHRSEAIALLQRQFDEQQSLVLLHLEEWVSPDECFEQLQQLQQRHTIERSEQQQRMRAARSKLLLDHVQQRSSHADVSSSTE